MLFIAHNKIPSIAHNKEHTYLLDTCRDDHHFMELKTLAMWLFRGSVFRSGSGYQIGLGDRAMGWLTRGTEESVLQVQLVPSFAGTDIESRHMSFGIMMLLSVLEPMSACTSEAVCH